MSESTTRIWAVDGNPADIRLLREILRVSDRRCVVRAIDTGDAALALLDGGGSGDGSDEMPDLIFLDLYLPGTPGLTVLEAIKSSPRLGSIPVIAFTSLVDEGAVAAAYDRGANCVTTKSLDLDEYARTVQGVVTFCLETIRLPPRVRGIGGQAAGSPDAPTAHLAGGG